jgi:hypothetical protein
MSLSVSRLEPLSAFGNSSAGPEADSSAASTTRSDYGNSYHDRLESLRLKLSAPVPGFHHPLSTSFSNKLVGRFYKDAGLTVASKQRLRRRDHQPFLLASSESQGSALSSTAFPGGSTDSVLSKQQLESSAKLWAARRNGMAKKIDLESLRIERLEQNLRRLRSTSAHPTEAAIEERHEKARVIQEAMKRRFSKRTAACTPSSPPRSAQPGVIVEGSSIAEEGRGVSVNQRQRHSSFTLPENIRLRLSSQSAVDLIDERSISKQITLPVGADASLQRLHIKQKEIVVEIGGVNMDVQIANAEPPTTLRAVEDEAKWEGARPELLSPPASPLAIKVHPARPSLR